MDLLASASSEARFLAYVEGLVGVIGMPTGLCRCTITASGC